MSPSTYEIRVAFSVTNCICFDQRVLKIAGVLKDMGCDVIIIGRIKDHQCRSQSVTFRTKRFRMIFRRGFLFYKFYNIRLFFWLLTHKYDLLVSNDLDTLLANYLVSRIRGIPLVFDSHEYFTGLPELKGRSFVTRVWKLIERKITPRLKYIMTVSDSVAEQYEKEYKVRPSVIRNCSPSSREIRAFSKQELGIKEDHLLLVFQGGGINMDKGGEELIESLSITEGVSLLVIGSGDVLPAMKKNVVKLNLSERVKFVPRMPWKEMMRYTKSADVGFCIEKDTNLNYHFSLPNKLFDYISAGKPVIASGVPEVKKVIEEFGCGVFVTAVSPEEISNAIIKLMDDRILLERLSRNSVTASDFISWEYESKKVLDFYRQILNDACSV